MIVAFGEPHRIGSVCSFPCEQCGDSASKPEWSEFTGRLGESLPFQPLFIIREASRDEYIAFVEEVGGFPSAPGQFAYYYEVHTD